MAYNKTLWKDRIVEKPNTYRKVENSDGTITLYPVTGQVIEKGTPVSAANLNKIENGIVEVYKELDTKIDGVANKGTTVAVLERVTKQEIDRQIADGTMANLTIAPGSITKEKLDPNIKFGIENGEITNEKIADGAITKNKLNTNFKFNIADLGAEIIKPGKLVNLFDKTKGEAGYLQNWTGKVVSNTKDWTSDYIECFPGEVITKCENSSNSVNTQNVCFYSKDKTFIKGVELPSTNSNWKTFVVPADAYFFRFDMLASKKETEEIYALRDNEGQFMPNVLDSNIKVEGANLINLKVGIEHLNTDVIIPTNLSLKIINLFDKTKGEKGWVNSTTGNIERTDKDWASDYIDCFPGEVLQKCDDSSNKINAQNVAFYSKDKHFVGGVKLFSNSNWKTFVVPADAYFFRFDMLASKKETEEIYAERKIGEDNFCNLLSDNIKVPSKLIKDLTISLKDLANDVVIPPTGKTTNLFDKTKGEAGYLQNWTGMVASKTTDWTSDYIECFPGETITKCENSSNSVNTQNVCFYSQDKNFIKGVELPKTNSNWKTFVVPADAYFFRFDMLASKKETEEIYAIRGGTNYSTLSDDIKINKTNILGIENDDNANSIVIGDTGDKYTIGVDCRGRVYSKFINTEIPIVELNGNMDGIGKDKKVTVDIKYRSKTKNFDGKCTLAWQGNGSINYPKKNYKIKLMDNEGNKMKIGFRNWIPQDSYHLKANFTDSSHMRNIFSANLMYDIRKEDLPTGGRGIIDGFPIKVKINGKDQGIYTWNLKQSKEVYGLVKENPNHLMYRCENHWNAGSFANTSNTKAAWEDKFPETSDPLVAADNLAKLNKMINWVATADDATFRKDIHKYLNLNYLIDYWIYVVCFMGKDSLGRNMNLVTYDGEVWYTTLYDMDTCMGINYNGGALNYDLKIPSQADCPNSVLFKKLRDNFKGEIINRYLELRNTAFATESLLTKIKEYMDFIGTRNYLLDRQLWSGINTSAISYSYIANNITQRLAMIDDDLTILTDGR